MLGDIDNCLELLEKIPANNKLRKEAILYIWIALWVKGEKVLAEDYLKEMGVYDAELGSFLEMLQKYLIYDSIENENFFDLISEKHFRYFYYL